MPTRIPLYGIIQPEGGQVLDENGDPITLTEVTITAASTNAVINYRYLVDVSSNAMTVNLPDAATASGVIEFFHTAGDLTTNILTVGRVTGADTVDGVAADRTYAIDGTVLRFRSANGVWVVEEEGATAAAVETNIPNWAATTAYLTNDVVVSGGSLYRRIAAGTSGASFDAAEAATWTHLGQSSVWAWSATTAYAAGVLVRRGDLLLERTAAGTSGASFDAAELATWTVLSRGDQELQALSDAASITWDHLSGRRATVTITADRAMAAPTNVAAGATASLRVTASGADRVLTFDTSFKDESGTSLSGITIPSGESLDLLFFSPDGSDSIYLNPEGTTAAQRLLLTGQTLTDAATITWDASAGNLASVSVAVDRAIALPTNFAPRGWLYLLVTNSDASAHDITFAAGYFDADGAALTTASIPATGSRAFAFFTSAAGLYQIGGGAGGAAALAAWAATTAYEAGQFVVQGGIYLQRTAAGTSGASFDVTEAADWTYLSQSSVPAWAATTVYVAGTQVRQDGALLERVATGTSGASFDVTEAADWTVLSASGLGLTQTLTDAASVAWDASAGRSASVTITANRTMAAPTNLVAGMFYHLEVTASGAARTISFDPVFKGLDGGNYANTKIADGETERFDFFSPDGAAIYPLARGVNHVSFDGDQFSTAAGFRPGDLVGNNSSGALLVATSSGSAVNVIMPNGENAFRTATTNGDVTPDFSDSLRLLMVETAGGGTRAVNAPSSAASHDGAIIVFGLDNQSASAESYAFNTVYKSGVNDLGTVVVAAGDFVWYSFRQEVVGGSTQYTALSGVSTATVIPAWANLKSYEQGAPVLEAGVYLLRTAAGTSGASFDATEAADWTYMGQTSGLQWAATTVYVAGTQVYQNGNLWERTAAGTSGASFDATEALAWTLLQNSAAAGWQATTYYPAGSQVTQDSRLLVRAAAGVSGASFDATEAAAWAVQDGGRAAYAQSTFYMAGDMVTDDGAVWRRTAAGTSPGASISNDIANWSLVSEPRTRLVDALYPRDMVPAVGAGLIERGASSFGDGQVTYLSDVDSGVSTGWEVSLGGISFSASDTYTIQIQIEEDALNANHVIELGYIDGGGNEAYEMFEIGNGGLSNVAGGSDSGNVSATAGVFTVARGGVNLYYIDLKLTWTGASGASPRFRIIPVLNLDGGAAAAAADVGLISLYDIRMGNTDEFWDALPPDLTAKPEQTVAFTAVRHGLYPVNTTAAAVVVTPPVAPVAGVTRFAVADSRGTSGIFPITVDFVTAGDNFYGAAQNDLLNTIGASRTYRYIDATVGWIMENTEPIPEKVTTTLAAASWPAAVGGVHTAVITVTGAVHKMGPGACVAVLRDNGDSTTDDLTGGAAINRHATTGDIVVTLEALEDPDGRFDAVVSIWK